MFHRAVKVVMAGLVLMAMVSNARAVERVEHKDIEYGNVDGHSLKLDLYLPKDAKGEPLVVWIHGGGWRQGSKSGVPILYLVDHGYAVASVEYRFSQVAIFPAQIHDCKAAIRFLRAGADKYGYDAKRIGVAGGSAGGHLVAMLGTTADVKEVEGDVGGNLDQSSRVQAVVDLYGPTDFINFLQETGDPTKARASVSLNQLFGGPPDEHADLAKLASPLLFVSPDDAPTLILHGEKDPIVPLKQSTDFDAALRKAGVPCELVVVPGAGHGGKEFGAPELQRKILEFFDKYVKSDGK